VVKKAAAWRWLHEGSGLLGAAGGAPVKLVLGLFSKLMTLGIVVAKVGSEDFWASLGHSVWGALLWPLRADGRDEDGMHTWVFDENARAVWVFLTDPLSWYTYHHQGVRISKGIVLKQIGAPELLVKSSLRQSVSLSHMDLVRLAEFFRLDTTAGSSRDQLLEHLGNFLAPGNTSYVEEIKTSKKNTTAACLVEDPLFDAAYEALDDDDKREFTEVREARQKGEKRNFEEALSYRRVRAKAAAKAAVRRRAKAKAKAHASVPRTAALPPPPLPPPPAPQPLAVVPPPPIQEGPAGVFRIPAQALRGDRSIPFGTSWVLSEVHPGGVFTTWSCSCYIHTADGQRLSYPFTVRMYKRGWLKSVTRFGLTVSRLR